jgi:hypothetical protein
VHVVQPPVRGQGTLAVVVAPLDAGAPVLAPDGAGALAAGLDAEAGDADAAAESPRGAPPPHAASTVTASSVETTRGAAESRMSPT